MNGRCRECGASTERDQELGSAVCTHCGTLADPTQSVLTSHLDLTDISGREYPLWNTVHGSTLKGRNGWALSGQSKDARDRNNTIAMHEFIRSVVTRLGHPGVASRAQGVFDKAMTKGQYRWGRKAKLTAGAAIAVALRESHKSDSLRDIAYLLEENPLSLSRAFTSLVTLLNLHLAAADPSMHLPPLQAHLQSLTQESSSLLQKLPAKLKIALVSLVPRLPAVLGIATSLAALLSRTNTLAHVPTPPTACALLILALEAELLAPLPHAGVLAEALGTRLGAGKGVVMQRYKVIYDLVEEWIRDVPWLEAHERTKGGRSKVAKRVVVARGLKDVAQFQEDIWKRRMLGEDRPRLKLLLAEGEDDVDEEDKKDTEHALEAGTSTVPIRVSGTVPVNASAPRKKRKTQHDRSIAQASQFLLNPLASSSSAVMSPSSTSASASAQPPGLAEDGSGATDLLTHLLTVDSTSLSHAFANAPTRLQLLASSRGGAREADIADEELFAEGELEGLFRSAEEADVLRVVMGWEVEEERIVDELIRTKKRKSADEEYDDIDGATAKGKTKGSKRIDMDALARLLDPSTALNDDFEAYERDCVSHFVFAEGEEVVEEWRPMSPGGGFDEDRYEM